MHTINRILLLTLLVVALSPLGITAVVTLQDKQQAEDSLQSAIDAAVGRYRSRTGLRVQKEQAEKVLASDNGKLESLERDKRLLRAKVVSLRRVISTVRRKYGLAFSDEASIRQLLEIEKRMLMGAVRTRYLADFALVRRTLVSDASVQVHVSFEREQLMRVRDLSAALRAFVALEEVEHKRQEVLSQYGKVRLAYDHATEVIEHHEENSAEIQRIMADVHEQVLRLQGELSRIDARLKDQAKRKLLEKGLLDPEEIAAREAMKIAPSFRWPVYGPVSAGFMNASYKRYFGVPHYGTDIVVDQGTPVASAQDGVVFLVRDGGQKGYTYVLIGHRDGYATLYGHLSAVVVAAGQEVAAGQIIGASGGKPGTYGAGPMTTNPHLHFEVIQNGVNIDPGSVLP